MANRDTQDNRIDAWEAAVFADQNDWRENSSTTGNYGQVLRGGERPHDQPEDGPTVPAQLSNDAWIDVYETPNGFGWVATVEAVEGANVYRTALSSHEGSQPVAGPWVLQED